MAKKTAQKEFTKTEEGDDLAVLSVSDRIRTVEDALKFGEIDTAVWYVASQEVTSYECPMKIQGREGKADKPIVIKLWRVKLGLKRLVAKPIQEASNALILRMQKHAPKYPKARYKANKDPHMLEVSVFDAHFGKLAWAPETGQNYDLKIAERIFFDAVQSLVADAKGHHIEKVLFPVGQDFLHIDNVQSTTTGGTPQDSDGRYAKIFEAAVMACVKAIDYLSTVAPVKVIWVPGNHDRTASYHVARTLDAWYRLNKDVAVDRSPTWRKYEAYGPQVIGFTHGDQEKHSSLPAIMMHEARKLMSKARSLEIHLGHLHKAKETVYVNTDSHSGGVRVRILPSLSGTDQWHYGKGYDSDRAAEAYLWSKSRGYVAHFSANVHGDNIAKRRTA